MVGQTISHYRVVEKLGEGGMGIVYKAVDTNLGRTVALKFLAAHLLESEEHKLRFLHEAKAAALLDHPGICTVYEIAEAAGQTFLAMAYLDGQTLKQKIAERPLPFAEALDLTMQIASGLQAAHDKSIVHRDIKPANLMITPQGDVKIMDFGLAQLTDRTKLTATGTKLGTPAYMSPEQTEGRSADRRSDIWALGVVLYEMVSGRMPFPGEAEAAVAYAVVHTEPEPLTALRSGLPIALDQVIRKALAKAPADRYQHVDDLLVDLRTLRRTLQETPLQTLPRGERAALPGVGSGQEKTLIPQASAVSGGWRALLPWGVATLAVVLTLWSWIANRAHRPPQQPIIRTSIVLPPDQEPRGTHFAISPDGADLVYMGRRPQLFLRRLGQFDVRPLPGTERGERPFFSPDGQWVGFSMRRALQKVSVTGGAPVKICDMPSGFNGGARASWGFDDRTVYSVPASGLLQVPAAGGEPVVLTTLDVERGESHHTEPQILPDGKGVLFTILSKAGSQVAIVSVDSGRKTLVTGLGEVTWARYLPTGHLVYVRAGEVLVVPFDLRQAKATGPPRTLFRNIDIDHYPTGEPCLAISESGLLVYRSPTLTEQTLSLVWVERDGQATLLAPGTVGSRHVRVSADGRRVVEAGTGIWVLDIERGTRTRLSESGFNPAWTPDSRRVAFSDRHGGQDSDVYWRAADGSGDVEPLLEAPYTQWPTSWSPDGKRLAFFEDNPQTGWDIGILSLEGEPRRSAFLNSSFNEFSGAFSPNGKWMAYVSDESGRYEVYVRPYPGPGPTIPISTNGGIEPVWARDGSELFYRNGDQMLAIAIATKPEFRAGQPVVLFEGPYEMGPVLAVNYDVSRDGKKFLMLREEPESRRRPFNLVLNWFEEVKRLAPVEE